MNAREACRVKSRKSPERKRQGCVHDILRCCTGMNCFSSLTSAGTKLPYQFRHGQPIDPSAMLQFPNIQRRVFDCARCRCTDAFGNAVRSLKGLCQRYFKGFEVARLRPRGP